MKRFHVHVSVRDLDESVRFYSALFAERPTVHEAEYAKWMLDDPRVNFAISTRSGAPGVDHLGIQAENADELAELGARLDAAGQAVVPEAGAECCHARSDKFWTQDPQGTRWETFHTVGRIATYHGASGACEMSSARAADLNALAADAGGSKTDVCCDETTPQGVCCAPKTDRAADASCCGPVVAVAKNVGCALSGCGDGR
ncbi:MAG: glyoxalase/bleomycin resistance/dioxygenase family protein [Lysobacter sp.]|nr:MAG: glyoxalase/bleomycin resistance/dioxygenase family protein [Lysobacter sp.]